MKSVDDHTVLGTRGYEEMGVSGKVMLSAEHSSTHKTGFIKMLSGFGGCNATLYAKSVESSSLSLNETKAAIDPVPSDLVGMKINPKKDIDGVSPYNIGEVFYPKEDSFIPCTAAAVIKMLEFYDLDLTGKNAVVLGRSNVIGKPVAMLLLAKNATVTVCHSRTQNLKEVCKNADVLVSAIGKAHFVTKEFVKEGAIVVDVGTNYDENGKVTGDVDFDEVSEIASYINPVPGGIGSITTSVLAEKCLIAARKKVK